MERYNIIKNPKKVEYEKIYTELFIRSKIEKANDIFRPDGQSRDRKRWLKRQAYITRCRFILIYIFCIKNVQFCLMVTYKRSNHGKIGRELGKSGARWSQVQLREPI